VAPGGPTGLPLQSIALRTGSAPFLTVGSGLPGVGLVGDRQRFRRGRGPIFAAVSRSSCGSFGFSRRAPLPSAEALGGGFRSAGGSGRPRVDLVTVPLLRRQRAGSRGPFLAARARRPGWSGLDSSHGVQRSPLRRYKYCASTPGSAEAFPSARRRQPPNSFRPCRSTRLRRFTPLSTLQVYCTLQPAMGFAMFLKRLRLLGPKAAAVRLLHPRWRRPFEAFPSLAASTVSPRPWPSRCSLPLLRTFRARCRAFPVRFGGSVNLRALSHQEVRCERLGVAAEPLLDAPLGFDSFQVCGASGPGASGVLRTPKSSRRVPLPSGWPPRGSPVGRWRCLGGAGALAG
jgi:hypothetical protein